MEDTCLVLREVEACRGVVFETVRAIAGAPPLLQVLVRVERKRHLQNQLKHNKFVESVLNVALNNVSMKRLSTYSSVAKYLTFFL